MNDWIKDDLDKIAASDDLHVAPFRDDGETYGTPTWIWSVVVDGALYVRAYNGKASRWYQAALREKAGRISAADMTKEVLFEPIEGTINDRFDERARQHSRCSSRRAAERTQAGDDMDAKQFLVLGASMLAASLTGPVAAQDTHQPYVR